MGGTRRSEKPEQRELGVGRQKQTNILELQTRLKNHDWLGVGGKGGYIGTHEKKEEQQLTEREVEARFARYHNDGKVGPLGKIILARKEKVEQQVRELEIKESLAKFQDHGQVGPVVKLILARDKKEREETAMFEQRLQEIAFDKYHKGGEIFSDHDLKQIDQTIAFKRQAKLANLPHVGISVKDVFTQMHNEKNIEQAIAFERQANLASLPHVGISAKDVLSQIHYEEKEEEAAMLDVRKGLGNYQQAGIGPKGFFKPIHNEKEVKVPAAHVLNKGLQNFNGGGEVGRFEKIILANHEKEEFHEQRTEVIPLKVGDNVVLCKQGELLCKPETQQGQIDEVQANVADMTEALSRLEGGSDWNKDHKSHTKKSLIDVVKAKVKAVVKWVQVRYSRVSRRVFGEKNAKKADTKKDESSKGESTANKKSQQKPEKKPNLLVRFYNQLKGNRSRV